MAILPLTNSVILVWSCGKSWFTASGRSWTHFSQYVDRSCLLISPPISSSPQKTVTLTRADRGFPVPPRTSHGAPSLPSPTLTLHACVSFLLYHCKDYVRKLCVMCIKRSVTPGPGEHSLSNTVSSCVMRVDRRPHWQRIRGTRVGGDPHCVHGTARVGSSTAMPLAAGRLAEGQPPRPPP